MAVSRIRTRASRAGAPRPGTNGARPEGHEFTGPAKIGKRTKRLVKRLGPDDIAVIDHAAIDRVSGEDLAACGVRHVVNVSRSASPKYGNQGPVILTDSGVHLVDMPGAPLFDLLKDGQQLTLRGGTLLRGDEVIWEGEVQDREAVTRAYEEGKRGIGEALESFAANTMTHIREERELLAGDIELPEFDTYFRDRPAMVVVRGVDHK
ncbi:MAG: hypothetical protein QOE08_1033, partial [Thermoleophilaceae bacterium]|nr:hypothetical protein [Thermoleophilaceae bacterium]